MTVYVLYRLTLDMREDWIGIFSTKEKAEAVLKTCGYPQECFIEEYVIDETY